MEATKSLHLTQNAFKVLEKRYLKKNEEGKVVETTDDLFRRVASSIANADRLYGKTDADVKTLEEEFYNMLTNLEFLPNSPTLMNAGRRLGQLSACFVLPVDDSMESIFDAVKNTAIIHKSDYPVSMTDRFFGLLTPCGFLCLILRFRRQSLLFFGQ